MVKVLQPVMEAAPALVWLRHRTATSIFFPFLKSQIKTQKHVNQSHLGFPQLGDDYLEWCLNSVMIDKLHWKLD
jgi:hypothetical protein